MIKTSNLNNSILFLLVVGSITGSAIYLGIAQLQFFRIILFLSTLYTISLAYKKGIKIEILSKVLLSWFVFYFIWTFLVNLIGLGIFDFDEIQITSYFNFIIIFMLVFNIVIYLNLNTFNFTKVVYKSLNVMFIVMIVIAFFEIFTKKHLSTATFFDNAPEYIAFQPATFYTNPNDFMAIFTLMLLFIIAYYKSIDKKYNFIIVIYFLIASIFAFITNARLAMLIIFFSAIFIFFTKKNIVKFSIVILIMIFGFSFFSNIFISDGIDIEYLINGLSFSGESSGSRISLYKWAIYSINTNYGLGFGIDNSMNYYQSISDPALKGIVNPHNYILELLINSGVIVVLSYILFNLIFLFLFLKRRLFFLSYLLVIYPIILMSSSSSLFLWFHYVYQIALIGLYYNYKNIQIRSIH
jgi:teichuronic acid biosynthesis protein TuaE